MEQLALEVLKNDSGALLEPVVKWRCTKLFEVCLLMDALLAKVVS